jgi:hypothetical protein
MQVSYTATIDDYVALFSFLRSRSWGLTIRLVGLWVATVVVTIFWIILVLLIVDPDRRSPALKSSLFLGIAFAYLVYDGWRKWRRVPQEGYEQERSVIGTGGLVLELTPEELRQTSALFSSTMKWGAIEEIAETNAHLFFIIRDDTVILVPRRAFPGENEAQAFLDTARSYLAAHTNEPVEA